jgi:hypothetical protein
MIPKKMIPSFFKRHDRSDEALRAISGFRESLQNVSLETGIEVNPNVMGASAPVMLDNNEVVISLRTDQYTEVAKNIFDRVLTGPNDVRFDHEGRFKKQIQRMNFDDAHVVFVTWGKGAEFKEHFHRQMEVVYCLAGSYISLYPKKIDVGQWDVGKHSFKKGQKQILPPLTIHTFESDEPGYALIELYKN